MASRNINDLSNEMKVKVLTFKDLCKENGLDILIYCTLRTLEEQAILYRQGHSSSEVREKIKKFNERGFDYLAKILEDVGPQKSGKRVTNAACGESWHNYAEAIDGCPILHGKPVWTTKDDPTTTENEKELWDVYGKCAKESGLYWAGNWEKFKEYPHIQLRKGSNPLKELDPDQIKEILIKNKLL